MNFLKASAESVFRVLSQNHQLGRDASKIGSSKSLVFKSVSWAGNTLGLVPASLPHALGYACTFYAPTSPPPNDFGFKMLLSPN